jgi:hypothetical protein
MRIERKLGRLEPMRSGLSVAVLFGTYSFWVELEFIAQEE